MSCISLKTPATFLITILLFVTFSLSGVFFAYYLSIYRKEKDCNWIKDTAIYVFLVAIVSIIDALISILIAEAF